MTDKGCDNRLYAAEWHAELLRRCGLPQELYEELNLHLTECVKADYFGVPRPQTEDLFLREYEVYMDRVYTADKDFHTNPLTGELLVDFE